MGSREILVLTPFFSCEGYEEKWDIKYDPQGGMQLLISRLCIYMSNTLQDMKFTVITMGQPRIPKERLYAGKIKVLSRRVPIPKIHSSLGGYCGLIKAWAVATFFELFKFPKDRFIVIFAHADGSGTAMLLYYLAKKILRIPLILQIHSSRGATQRPTNLWEKITNSLAVKMELKTVSCADKIYVLSDYTKEYYTDNTTKELNIEKIVYLPISNMRERVDKTRVKQIQNEINPSNRKILLYLGRISEEKGWEAFVELSEYLSPDKYMILICGDGPDLQKMRKKIHDKKKDDLFTFMGFIKHEDVQNYITLADIGIVPSKYEELGLVILEMMSMGLPVISYNLPTVRQIIEHKKNGLLVEQDNILDMYDSIRQLCMDKVLYTRISQNAIETSRVICTGINNVGDKIGDYIREVGER